MKRFVFALFPALLVFALTIMPAAAGVQWCRTDPIVAFNGTEVNLWLSIPEQWEATVTGPADFTVSLPSDVTREVVFMDEGFNGFGETVTFVDTAAVNGGNYQVQVFADVAFMFDPIPLMDVPLLLTIEMPDGTTFEFEGSSQTGVSGSFEMTGANPPV